MEEDLVREFSRNAMKKKEEIFFEAIKYVDDFDIEEEYIDYLKEQDIQRKMLPNGDVEYWYNGDHLYTIVDLPIEINQKVDVTEAVHKFGLRVVDDRCKELEKLEF